MARATGRSGVPLAELDVSAKMPRDAGALSLAIGVCVLRALEPLGVSDVRLKWPNDVLVADRKLGGILIELRAESAGPACAVVGIGLNVALGAELLEKIATTGLPAVDLASVAATRRLAQRARRGAHRVLHARACSNSSRKACGPSSRSGATRTRCAAGR